MMKSLSLLRIALIFGIFILSTVRPSTSGEFTPVTGPCDFRFPEDHGPHRQHRSEWWYYTGILRDAGHRAFGFQLTLFRSALSPDEPAESDSGKSAWRTRQIFMGHMAISDTAPARHRHAELLARESPSIAGAMPIPGGWRLFIRNWEIRIDSRQHTLKARQPDMGIDLTLIPQKGPIPHGDQGYSRKGSTPERASCYYSFPEMAASGSIELDGHAHRITGTAWMDHEYSSAPLEPGAAGWDWFSVRLSDQTDLMVYLIRLSDGTWHPASGGTLIRPDGTGLHLNREDVIARPGRTWKSPVTGGVYPLEWQLILPGQGLDLTVSPWFDAQEMTGNESAGMNYWEGAVTVDGKKNSEKISGEGYMELTGYAEALDF